LWIAGLPTETVSHMASYSPRTSIRRSPKFDPTFFCQSSPLIFTFSSNSMYVMFTYVFPFAMVPL
jgi:hypothetical protein